MDKYRPYLVAVAILAFCSISMSQTITVTQSPANVTFCRGSNNSQVTMSAAVSDYPGTDYECVLGDESWVWSGNSEASTGSTAVVYVSNTPPPPSGSVEAVWPSTNELTGDDCGDAIVGPANWTVNVTYSSLQASVSGQSDALEGGEPGCLPLYTGSYTGSTGPYQTQWNVLTGDWAYTTTNNQIELTDIGVGTVQVIFSVTDGNGCTQNAVKMVTVHSEDLQVTEDPGSPTLQPTPGDPAHAMLLAVGFIPPAGNFTMSATLSGMGSCSINASNTVTALLETQFGFTITASIAITASESYPIIGNPGDEWGLYGQILHQHHTGTAIEWNCDGTSTSSNWTADQYYGPGAFVDPISPK